MNKRIILAISYLQICFLSFTQAQISGIVTEAGHWHPLPGVIVTLYPDSIFTVTDNKGRFTFDIVAPTEEVKIVFQMIGFEEKSITVSYPAKNLIIKLSHDNTSLSEVLILEDHAKHEHTLHSTHLNEKYFDRNNAGTISQALSKIPGMQSIDLGPGIGKPVIRGLFGNRIIVNKDYIKQEGQQWGNDHGLEMDPFDVQRVEIIKGPGSLQYGSDGLGGVINILPQKIPEINTLNVGLRTLYKSNNQHKATSLGINARKNGFFFQVRASIQDYQDYRVPASSFVYNGFELPIYNNLLKNTAGTENSYSLSAGYKGKHSVTRLTFSEYRLKAGIFTGAVGTPRSYTLTDDGNPNNIDVPYQNVKHTRAVLNHIYFIGNNHLTFNVGFQNNVRAEHSLPESHSLFDIMPGETKAIGLNLKTFTYETHYDYKIGDRTRNVIGINGQYQQNIRDGYEFFLSDFTTFRQGGYSFIEHTLSQKITISGGLRIDYGSNTLDSFYLARRDRQGVVFDETITPHISKNYLNWSASSGIYHEINEKWTGRYNLGKSFRIPYPNELGADGIHHGNFRHEIGNDSLKSEHGYQLDLSLDYRSKRLTWVFSTYFNYFDDYIYLSPGSTFSTRPEAGLMFSYVQTNAIYSGFEMEYEYQISKGLKLRQGFEYLYSHNLRSNLALPFTPQPSVLTEASFEKKLKKLNVELILSHQYFMANGINRTDRNELQTPSYHLFDLIINVFNFKFAGDTEIQLQVKNIFNSAYLNHMSRYRLLNLPEQGRNFILAIKIPFQSKL